MERGKLINPTFEEVQELRVAVQDAEKHFPILRDELFAHCFYEMAKAKRNTLYGLFKSNKMSKSLGTVRTWFDDAGLNIPDELWGMNDHKRKFYIQELLILISEYLEVITHG